MPRPARCRYLCLVSAYLCLVEARLHFGQSQDLKGKRKQLHSLKVQLRQRFGAAVAETDGHDTWQRTTLLCALVGDGGVTARADELERFVESRCPDGCSFERDLLSLEDLRG
jgi:uncharacterized protein